MQTDAALGLFSDLIWVTLIVCAPLLLLALVVGVLVSVVQVVTQIQDMSLSFIPKVLAVVVGLTAFGPWMLRKVLLYASGVIAGIPKYFP